MLPLYGALQQEAETRSLFDAVDASANRKLWWIPIFRDLGLTVPAEQSMWWHPGYVKQKGYDPERAGIISSSTISKIAAEQLARVEGDEK